VARSGRGLIHRSSARRKKSWISGPGGTTGAAISGVAATILGGGLQLLQDGLTLVRLRGQFDLFLTTVTAAGDGFTGAMGIGIVTEHAFGIGTTAMPTPIAEPDWDGWIYWTPISVHGPSTAANGGSNADAAQQRFLVDTKSMRKLREDDVVFAMLQMATEEGTAVGEVRFDSRMLLLLP